MITAREIERLQVDLERLRRDAVAYADLAALAEEAYRRLVVRAVQATARLTQFGPEARPVQSRAKQQPSKDSGL